ncbi:MAG: adenosylcobalamin-dependent ribonucleoside-diphosphate reductase [Nanoarchaeota archaeon]|nr:adenosylcobalamin-dependent ribonucleoside-diphosphate reductase [Nanoarchaeota archaeon]
MELPEYAKNRVKFTNGKIRDIFLTKYAQKGADGKACETPEDIFFRVAREIALVDKKYDANSDLEAKTKVYFGLMANFEFLPNSPTLMNAGLTNQLAACYVLPIEDSRKGIFGTLADAVEIQAFGGGTGFDFSGLRPKGSKIRTTGGRSSGPVSFMEIYDIAIGKTIAQGGKRKGANMGCMAYDHPDIIEFIYTKFFAEIISSKMQEMQGSEDAYVRQAAKREAPMSGFNLSVKVSDEFMKLAMADGLYPLKNPHANSNDVQEFVTKADMERLALFAREDETFKADFEIRGDDILNTHEPEGSPYRVIGSVKNGKACLYARKVLELVANMAWRCGCPGVIFIDRMNENNPTPGCERWIPGGKEKFPGTGKIKAANPCGEQPLLDYESCNLGSVNLTKMIAMNDGKAVFDFQKLESIARIGYRFLDNVIDAIKYPESVQEKIDPVVKANRKIGLGIMGFADACVELGIDYGSNEARELAAKIMETVHSAAVDESEKRASERGAFPNFERSVFKNGKKMRNATLTTIAPTGTIGTVAEVSEGIEPLFGMFYTRKTGEGKIIHIKRKAFSLLEDILAKEGIRLADEVAAKVQQTGSVQHTYFPEKIKKAFRTAYDLGYEEHILMQAAFQKAGVDNAVSKTINMRNSATIHDVFDAYVFAWQQGCKGTTIYRDGSKSKQVLNFDVKKKGKSAVPAGVRKRAKKLPGETVEIETPHGAAFITLNPDEYGLREVFVNIGQAGSDVRSYAEAIGKLISLSCKYSIPAEEIASKLRGIGGRESVGFGEDRVLSVPDAIGKVIAEFEQERTGNALEEKISIDLCPNCGCKLEMSSGCLKCSCGYSKC